MKLQSHLQHSLILFRYQAQLCISSQLMSLGRVYTASLPWSLKMNLLQWKNALAFINGNAEHDKNWWCLFCFTGILFASLSGTQHTRILDEAQFIEISGTGITELCLIQPQNLSAEALHIRLHCLPVGSSVLCCFICNASLKAAVVQSVNS